MKQLFQNPLHKELKIFLLTACSLVIIGLIFIYSASSVYALESFGVSFYFLKKQLLLLIPALIAFLVCSFFPLNYLKKLTPLFFLVSLILMLLTFIPQLNIKVHGASRWIRIFFINLQPSEFLKVTLFLYFGFFIERKQNKLTSLTEGYLPFLVILAICSLMLFKQPDFGTVITIFATSFIIFFVAGFSLTHLFYTGVLFIPLAILAIFFKSYRLNRILIFLDPWSDSLGRGYQIIQSLIAISSGSIIGSGIGYSKQKFFYLPMQHTDFIFSIIAEETGFIGSLIVIFLYLCFFYFGMKISFRINDIYSSFATLGFVVLLTLQASINLMVVCGIVPTKGLSLPFISYGGSALIANFCILGLILNFVRNELRRQIL